MFLWNAFQELAHDRPVMPGGELPIAWSTLDRYARRYRIEGEAFETFVAVMRAMDGEYLIRPAEPKPEERPANG